MTFKQGTVLQQRYRVIRLLGEGGFGAVYLAEDSRLSGRQLALKVSFDNSPEAETQFQFEASTLASLKHTGLPSVTDYFIEAGGQLFLVMDFVKGRDLTDEIVEANGPLPVDKAMEWMCQVCEAVAYLHAQPKPIIHRDIKPPNIKITPDGRAVLVDFGIAKQYTPGKRTAKIAKAFSPGFSPLEQYVGTTDARSDVYSLGATLYCLVTAEVPPDAFEERLQGVSLPQPSRFNSRLLPAVEQVIMRSMAMSAQYRYPNAGELLRAMRACISGAPAAAGVGLACSHCGLINRPGARFCARDGTPLAAPSAKPAVKPPAAAPPKRKPPAIDPTAARKHNVKGLALSKQNKPHLAAPEYEKAIELDPKNPVYHYNLAIAYLRMDRLQDALSLAQTAESLDSSDPDYVELIGRVYHRLKKHSQSIAAYRQAIRLSPGNASLHNELGDVYLDNGEERSAASAYREATRLEPGNAQYQLDLSMAHYRQDEYREAQQAVEKAIQNDPDWAVAHNFLGVILYRVGDHRGALRAQEKAFELAPDNATYACNVAMDYIKLRKKRQAIQLFKKALALDPGSKTAREQLRELGA